MTTPSSSISYANALRGASGPRAPVQALPLHHAPLFQENTIYVNLRAAAVDYTQEERDSFLKDDLGLRTEDVLDLFLEPSTLHLHLTLATPALFAEILSRLFAGVKWTAVDNKLVHGWAAAAPLVSVRVTGVPRSFTTSLLKRHFETFGPVSKATRISDRTWSSAGSGVIRLLLQPRPGVVLPHFVNAAAAPAAPSTAAEAAARPNTALTATPSCGVLEAPSVAAVVATPSAAVAEASSKSSEAAASPAAVLEAETSTAALVAARPTAALVAAHPTAADDAALSTTPAAGRRLPPSPSRPGSPSSASDMSGAEDGGSETDGFHKPRRRRKRSPQSGSPGSMSPNQKTSKKEPG